MYRLVRYWVKTALLFFLIGLSTGLYMKAAPLFGWPYAWGLVQAHTHVLLVGFILMLIMGVATWFFPRIPKAPLETPLGWVTYGMMAGGTGLRYATEVVGAFAGTVPWSYLALAGGVAQVVGAVLFVVGIWPRIKAVGSQV